MVERNLFRIDERTLEVSENLKTPINEYFIPQQVSHPSLIKNKLLVRINDFEKDWSNLLYICYRKLRCTSCGEKKWADQFDWNRKGFEGPYKQFWGKRDSWCKACRSYKRKLRYSKKKKIKLKKTVESNKVQILEVGHSSQNLADKVARQLYLGDYIYEIINTVK